jgi:alkanesulfonate monooxygenase SsuD/methylene tetrahydromethanopterin reductase-like flavin-dependent oxidoreductase (luciferase family)
MRHGIFVSNIGTYADPRTVADLGLAAEEAGWEALFTWDHLGFVWGQPAGDPWITLAAVAARTERLVVGTDITPLPRRRPQVVAHQVATLDTLSGGRVVFGAGIGGIPKEFGAFGEEESAPVRAEMLDEGLEVVARLWAGEEVQHRGRHYTVDGVRLQPVPARGKIPIWIGGNSRAALRRAARFDGWAADTFDLREMTLSPGELTEKIAELKALRARPDAPFDIVVFGYSDPGDDDLRAALRVRGRDLVARVLPRRPRTAGAHAPEDRSGTRLGKSSEHPPEQRMPPGGEDECSFAEQRRQAGLAARRVVTVDEGAEREECEVLAESHGHCEAPFVDVHPPPRLLEDEPEHRAVRDVHGQADSPPTRPAREELAEHRDVRVVMPDDPFVQRLLQRPDRGSDGSGGG